MKEKNPLTDGLLKVADYQCMIAARWTNLEPESGERIHQEHRARGCRFDAARAVLKRGGSLVQLGLTAEDCRWAKGKSGRAENTAEWRRRFSLAQKILSMAEDERMKKDV